MAERKTRFEICKCGLNSHSVASGIDKDGNKKYWYVCRGCGKSSQKYMGDTEQDAIIGWNTFIKKIKG